MPRARPDDGSRLKCGSRDPSGDVCLADAAPTVPSVADAVAGQLLWLAGRSQDLLAADQVAAGNGRPGLDRLRSKGAACLKVPDRSAVVDHCAVPHPLGLRRWRRSGEPTLARRGPGAGPRHLIFSPEMNCPPGKPVRRLERTWLTSLRAGSTTAVDRRVIRPDATSAGRVAPFPTCDRTAARSSPGATPDQPRSPAARRDGGKDDRLCMAGPLAYKLEARVPSIGAECRSAPCHATAAMNEVGS